MITVRTNRRVINYPHLLKQGETKPVPCTGLPAEIAQANIPNVDISEMEMSLRQRLFFTSHTERLLSCPPLSLMDPVPFVGGSALHASLAIFHSSYDSAMMLDHCDSLGDHQAAAKIALLEGQLTTAWRHQLKATRNFNDPKQALHEVLDYYCSRVEVTTSMDSVKEFLSSAITSWVELLYDVRELESILKDHIDRIGLALGLLLFCDAKAVAQVCLGVEGVAENFSTEFSQLLMDMVNAAMSSPEGDAMACQGTIEVAGKSVKHLNSCSKLVQNVNFVLHEYSDHFHYGAFSAYQFPRFCRVWQGLRRNPKRKRHDLVDFGSIPAETGISGQRKNQRKFFAPLPHNGIQLRICCFLPHRLYSSIIDWILSVRF